MDKKLIDCKYCGIPVWINENEDADDAICYVCRSQGKN